MWQQSVLDQASGRFPDVSVVTQSVILKQKRVFVSILNVLIFMPGIAAGRLCFLDWSLCLSSSCECGLSESWSRSFSFSF